MEAAYSLAYLTAARLSPPEAIDLAARTGYRFVGLRLLPSAPGGAAYPLHENAPLLRDTRKRSDATGVAAFDLEIIRIAPAFRATDFRSFMEAGQVLGAKAILVSGDDPDEPRLTASFARLCELASEYAMTCNLEFMPWTEVRDARAATRIVAAAAQSNGRVLIDALHFARSGSTLDDIAAIPPDWMNYAQICAAPGGIPKTVEEMIFTARSERLLPGEGGIDLAGLWSKLTPGLPVSIEIPSETRIAALGEEEWARRALAASRRVLAAAAQT